VSIGHKVFAARANFSRRNTPDFATLYTGYDLTGGQSAPYEKFAFFAAKPLPPPSILPRPPSGGENFFFVLFARFVVNSFPPVCSLGAALTTRILFLYRPGQGRFEIPRSESAQQPVDVFAVGQWVAVGGDARANHSAQ
jgi:hypothetical protein